MTMGLTEKFELLVIMINVNIPFVMVFQVLKDIVWGNGIK